MGKIHNDNDLTGRRTTRPLLAVSLAASLAAFGCTTNLNPGNGTPTRSGPEIRTAPTSGVTSGSERSTPTTSSYNSAAALPRVTPRSLRHTADEAAAIIAGRQPLRGRYLGVVNPGSGNGRGYASDNNANFVNPALLTNPQLTVNSSISSPPVGAISTGAGGGGGVIVGNAGALGATTGTTAAATLPGTTAGAVTATAATAPTAAGVGLPAGAFATVRPAVTESIGNNPGVTAASAGVGRAVPVTGATSVVGTTGTAVTTNAATTVTPTAASTAAATTVTANANAASGGVRIVRGTTGVSITNTTTTATTRAQ